MPIHEQIDVFYMLFKLSRYLHLYSLVPSTSVLYLATVLLGGNTFLLSNPFLVSQVIRCLLPSRCQHLFRCQPCSSAYSKMLFVTTIVLALVAAVSAAPAKLGLNFEKGTDMPQLTLPYGTWHATKYSALSDM
jgi:hypothetical protein